MPECTDANKNSRATAELTITGLGTSWKAGQTNGDININYVSGENTYKIYDFNNSTGFTNDDNLKFVGTATDEVWGVRHIDLMLKVYRLCGTDNNMKSVDIKPIEQIAVSVPVGEYAMKTKSINYSFKVIDLLTTIETSLCSKLNNTYFTAQVVAYNNNNCQTTKISKTSGPILRFNLVRFNQGQ